MKNLLINPGIIKRIKTFLTGKYVEDGNTASQNIPAGKWVIWKNQMCQAKTAITTGDTLSSTNLDVQGDDGAVNALNSNKIGPPDVSKAESIVNTAGSAVMDYTPTKNGWLRIKTTGADSIYQVQIMEDGLAIADAANTIFIPISAGHRYTTSGAVRIAAFYPCLE